MTSQTKSPIEFPIRQAEQAKQPDKKNLLAQDVYRKIAEHLDSSLKRLPKNGSDLDDHRSHEAILIDGGRGTGKSSVLVNLPIYLKDNDNYLILKPVDPTLLEDGDDLMLNVIVAALMRDETVKMALQNNEAMAEAFYDQLHKLGSSLEGMQTEKQKYGLDKLRSFMSNQALAEHVHLLFKKALKLTGKRLAILPIDDVDTSLTLAFKNIEVVRKYLTSPHVVPIISGDLNLYNEIVWREFYSRLTGNSREIASDAQHKTKQLAEEYQRKVLPLPRRIELPQLSTYLDNGDITLTDNGESLFSLPLLKYWLDALLNERVNGEGNSRLEAPLKTVREMAQFINAIQDLIPELKTSLDLNAQTPVNEEQALRLKRRLFMSANIAEAIENFSAGYQKAFRVSPEQKRGNRTARERAYALLRREVKSVEEDSAPYPLVDTDKWYAAIAEYFRYQRQNGAAYFTARVNLYWAEHSRNSMWQSSVLEHPLFQPTHLQKDYFDAFETVADLKKSWSAELTKRVPDSWLERLPERTILPYPVPEKGHGISTSRSGEWSFDRYTNPLIPEGSAELVRRLLIHWSFYSKSARTNLILTGRIFELIVTSLVRDITPDSILQILNGSPFFSVAALADTKAIEFQEADNDAGNSGSSTRNPDNVEYGDEEKLEGAVVGLATAINQWRDRLNIAQPHGWLIYHVMNKFFTQTHYIFAPLPERGEGEQLKHAVGIGVQAFNAIWAAFGSFEKGPLFGFPRVIAHMNMGAADKDFEQSPLYRQNILPFLQFRDEGEFFDFKTHSFTYALESHPLRELLRDVFNGWEIPLDQVITNTNLGGFTSAADAEADSRRVSTIFNNCAKRLDIRLNEKAMNNLSLEQLTELLTLVVQACKSPRLRAALKDIAQAPALPARSGRSKLQQCLRRYQIMTDTDFLSTMSA